MQVQAKRQKAKGKSKKRTPETWLCCGKEGHNKTNSRLRHVQATHEIEKDASEPNPEVTVEVVWCVAVRDTVDDGHCDCFEKHDVSSEHRDESKFTEFPEHRDESKIRKVITNIETNQNARKVIANIDTGQNSKKWSRRPRWMNRIGIEDKKSRHECIGAERVDGSKIAARNTQKNRDELGEF